MKFFAVVALLFTATSSAMRLEEDAEVQTMGMAELKTLVGHLQRINTRINQRDQENVQTDSGEVSMEKIEQQMKQLEQNNFDIRGAVKLGQGLLKKYMN